MRELFHSYYKPTSKEFDNMWQEGIFSFDTNVLLNIYRYTPETRTKLFEILNRLRDRIWIPYQVAYEYHERRLDVITDQFKASENIEKQLNKSLQDIEVELRKYKTHAFANIDQLTNIVIDAIENAKASLREAQSKHPDFLKSDSLLEIITDLFQDKVGQPYSADDMDMLYKEAEQRFEKNIPPGFEDRGKEFPQKYGDVIVWYQLIDHMKVEQKPLIFVTGDRKEDWWLRHKGRTVGPHRELLKEMSSKTGVLFYMYLTDQFMEQAEAFLNLQSHQKAIEEVRDVRRQDEENTSKISLKKAMEDIKGEEILEELDNLDNDVAFFVSTVNSAWQNVVNAVEAAAQRLGIFKPTHVPYHLITNRFVDEIVSEGHIEKEIEEKYKYLRATRNQIVHRGVLKEDATIDKALKYQKLCKDVIEAFDSIEIF